MADADTLAALFGGLNGSTRGPAELSDFQRTIAENDLWRKAAAPILGAKFNTATWSPGTTAGVTAGQAFLGALLDGYAKKQEAAQIEKVAAVLPQLYANPSGVAVPEGVDSEAFGNLKLSAMAKQAQSNEAVRQALGQQFIDVKPNGSLAAKPGAASAILELFNAKNPGASDPNNPESTAFKRAKAIAEEEDARRKEIAGTKTGSSLASVVSVLPVLDKLAKDDTKTSDIPFVYKFVQAQDGGVVKEGEQQMVKGASPLIQRFSATLNGALNGTSELTPAIKQQMVNEMKLGGKELYSGYKQEAEPLFKLGESRGATRAGMSPFNEKYLESLFSVPDVAGAATISIDSGGDVKQALQAIYEKAKSGTPLSDKEKLFVQETKKKLTPQSISGVPIG